MQAQHVFDLSGSYNTSIDKLQITLGNNNLAAANGLHFSHDVDIRHVMRKHAGAPFAGHVVRAGDQMMPTGLPACVVPMAAPFQPPFTDDWIRSFESALDSVTVGYGEHAPPGHKEKPFIIVPVQSPGGIVACLQQMLGCIDRAKSMNPPVTIVTYAVGIVASCAFILFQAGDVALSADCARFLCHEPTIPRAPANPGEAPQATEIEKTVKDAASLIALRDEIYERAEVCIFRRLYSSDSQPLITNNLKDPAVKTRLQELRGMWSADHQQQLQVFAARMQLQTGNSAPYSPTQNILKYITETIAKDVHNAWIDSNWMVAFNLCDTAGIVLKATRQEFITMDRETTAINQRRFIHADH